VRLGGEGNEFQKGLAVKESRTARRENLDALNGSLTADRGETFGRGEEKVQRREETQGGVSGGACCNDRREKDFHQKKQSRMGKFLTRGKG